MSRHPASVLAIVRRYEAAGFRAWPAAAVHYDGTWVVRLTAGHPAKRLNSVNPLDPGDIQHMADRIGRASRRFDAYGRPLTFRMSPLSGPDLAAYLDREGWSRFDESLVMRLPLADAQLSGAMDQIPLKDIGRFVDASLSIHERPADLRPGFFELLDGIRPNKGMFVLEDGGRPVSNVLCVQDGVMAGLFDVGTLPDARRKGHGHDVVGSALRWAAKLGAKTAWLQIEADNEAGLALYRRFGFREAYRYAYRESNEK